MADKTTIAARRRVALNARRTREKLKWTQEQAAEAVGCSVQQVRRIERAATNVTVDLVARIAAAYRVDLQSLFRPVVGRWIPATVGRPPRR